MKTIEKAVKVLDAAKVVDADKYSAGRKEIRNALKSARAAAMKTKGQAMKNGDMPVAMSMDNILREIATVDNMIG